MDARLNYLVRALIVWGLCWLAALSVACGSQSDATTTPASPGPSRTLAPTRQLVTVPTPPPGWNSYSRSTYQIALPADWQEVKLSENAIKDAIGAAQDSNPPLAEQLRALLESGQYQSLIFYATEKKRAPVVRSSAIARLPLTGTNDLEGFAKAYADALPNMIRGARLNEVQAPLKINGIRAAAFVYDISLVDSGGDLKTLRGVQYVYLLDSGDSYLVTVTGDAADREQLMPLAREIATSFVAVTP